jgi:hypothetical protein
MKIIHKTENCVSIKEKHVLNRKIPYFHLLEIFQYQRMMEKAELVKL